MCDGGGSSGSQVVTQQTNTAPWAPQQPYLKEGFQGAQDWFQSNQPEYFPDSTVVGFAPQTEQALRGMETRALTGSPVQQAGNQAALETAQGNFLSAGNPYFSGAFNASMAPAVEAFNRDVLPSVDSAFERAGRLGSNSHLSQVQGASDSMARAMAEQAAQMGYGNYAQERQNQLNVAAMAPQLAAADYQDAGQLAQVGAAREGLEGARLQDQINRFNFEQNKDKDKVAQYLGLVGGGFGTTGTSSTTQPLYSNPAGNFLSGALGGAGLGSMLGLSNPYTAGLAGIGGLFERVLMGRYVARPRGHVVQWSNDLERDVQFAGLTVFEDDDSRPTGILDRNGNEFWHVADKGPLGFSLTREK